MKINVEKDVLKNGLEKVVKIIGSKTTLPILANVLVKTGEGTITLTATDLELCISTTIEAEILEGGATTIPGKKLYDLTARFKGNSVSIESNENFHSRVKCGSANIMMVGMDPGDFPDAPSFDIQKSLKIKGNEIASLIEKVSYAASVNDTRFVLQGILFSIQNGVFTAAATDGKRMALVEKNLGENAPGPEADGELIVTLKFANELRRIFANPDELTLSIGENQILAESGKTSMTAKLIVGSFPNVRQIIPKNNDKVVVVSSEEMISAIDIVGVAVSDIKQHNIQLDFTENLLTVGASSTVSESTESLQIEYSGQPISASFNPVFLVEPFKFVKTDNMTLRINDEHTPVILDDNNGFIYLLMPIRTK